MLTCATDGWNQPHPHLKHVNFQKLYLLLELFHLKKANVHSPRFSQGFPKVLEKKLYLLRETLLGQDICKYAINLIAVPKPVRYIRTLSPSAP